MEELHEVLSPQILGVEIIVKHHIPRVLKAFCEVVGVVSLRSRKRDCDVERAWTLDDYYLTVVPWGSLGKFCCLTLRVRWYW